jgi:hypothetical protein
VRQGRGTSAAPGLRDTPSHNGSQVLLRAGVVICRRGPLPEAFPGLAESVALAVGFQDMGAVRGAIEQGSREALGARDSGPASEREVGGDEETCALVGPADDFEEELGSASRAGHVAEFIEDKEVVAFELLGPEMLKVLKKAWGRQGGPS